MDDPYELAARLQSGTPAERLDAADRLSRTGDQAATVAAALVEACADPTLQPVCVGTLEELGSPADHQLGLLGPLVASEHDVVAYWAATLLGRAGSAAAEHRPALEAGVRTGVTEAVRKRAAWALERLPA
ncbi:hypothetical protein [Botrimarina hoheduenensis]|uniref:HEAT repeat protein n=1 Tax=Botrimarina hoheduenensis TaxID=2528000 RepID=A0A5C5VZ35_9BACT|nr:hypothetical protein [Botrimarina hoheduenensis]TWT43305.1 hypothetical protein Pla111_22560 [Botrimarina hoheduenensis]